MWLTVQCIVCCCSVFVVCGACVVLNCTVGVCKYTDVPNLVTRDRQNSLSLRVCDPPRRGLSAPAQSTDGSSRLPREWPIT